MKKQTTALFVLLMMFVLLTQSCATLSKKECLGGEWRKIGFQDGSRGYGEDRWDDNIKACSKYGVRFDKKDYLKGRASGLMSYCTSQNGLREGRSGNHYRGVCPDDLEPAFLKSYNLGLKIHRLDQKIQSLESDIDRYEAQLKEQKLGDKERAQIRRTIREQGRTVERLKDQVNDLEDVGRMW